MTPFFLGLDRVLYTVMPKWPENLEILNHANLEVYKKDYQDEHNVIWMELVIEGSYPHIYSGRWVCSISSGRLHGPGRGL